MLLHRGTRLFAALIASGVLIAPALVCAQGAVDAQRDREARAKELYIDGKAAYAEGRYEESIAKFEEAFELTSRPLLLYNLSLAYERIGNYDKALENLRGYVAAAPPAEREVVRKRIQNLKKRAEAKHIEEEKPEAAALEPDKADDSKTPPDEKPADPAPTSVATERVDRGLVSNFGTPAIAALATGGVLLVASAVFGGLALGARGEVDNLCTATATGRLCRAAAREPMQRDQNLSLAADISLGVGAAAVGAGVLLLFWSPQAADEDESMGLSLVPLPGGGHVSFTGRY